VAWSFFQGRTRGIPGSIPRGTTLGQCACLYAQAGLVVQLWWVENGTKAKKINYITKIVVGVIKKTKFRFYFLVLFLVLIEKDKSCSVWFIIT
jgi:hypothetical protein